MRTIVVGVVILIVGFLFGVMYSTLNVVPPAEESPIERRMDLAMFKKLAELDANLQSQGEKTEAQLRGIHRTVAFLREQSASSSRETVSEAPASAIVAAPSPGPVTDRAAALAKLNDWRTDGAVRDLWTSASADQVLKALGPPDRVVLGAKENTMTYRLNDGARLVETYDLKLVDDRLVDVIVTHGK